MDLAWAWLGLQLNRLTFSRRFSDVCTFPLFLGVEASLHSTREQDEQEEEEEEKKMTFF